MRRAASSALRAHFPVLLAILVTVLTDGAAHASLRPGRPAPGAGDPEAFTPVLGEAAFTCGTYKGNESEHAQNRALHLRNRRDATNAPRSAALGLDYVYDDVWIIEDDGSLTLAGTNAFDTNLQTHQYAPGGPGTFTVSAIAFSYDATLGSAISPGDDGAVQVPLQFAFPFAGANYTQMYVSGNGAVSFGAVMNPNGFYDNSDFFSATPKIAPYYLDLNVTAGGTIAVKSEPTKYTVTWSAVREYGTTRTNTIQLVLYPNGTFTATYNGINSTTQSNTLPIIAGFHPGGNPPLDEISFSSGLPHTDITGAAVYEQYFSYANPKVDEVALFQRFYQQFPDDFFQLVFFTNFAQTMGGFANEVNIKNDVTGIGLGTFDASSQYGSNGVLESRCNMNRLSVWTSADPAARVFGKGNSFLTIMGQEAGHRWGAFMYFLNASNQPSNLMLGRDDAHWSYFADVDHSSLEGGNWVNTGGNNWSCPTQIDYFSQIDEYTFGLRTPNEVKDFYIIQSASNDLLANRDEGTPLQGAVAAGTQTPITVEDIIAYEGERTPLEVDENHDLRQGFILLIQQGTTPSQADLNKISGFRRAWEDYFEKSCDGRLTCNTSVTQTYDVAVLCGQVENALTDQPVPDFTARSLERGFSQHVPADGRYTFRYLESATSGPEESATVVFEAPGFHPDTVEVSIPYGTTKKVWVQLLPVQTAVGERPSPATELYANHPNPFNPSTTIRYQLGEAGLVRLAVYDAAGRHVRTLVAGFEPAGEHVVTFDGRDGADAVLASGVYFCRLEAGEVTRTRKLVLLK